MGRHEDAHRRPQALQGGRVDAILDAVLVFWRKYKDLGLLSTLKNRGRGAPPKSMGKQAASTSQATAVGADLPGSATAAFSTTGCRTTRRGAAPRGRS